MTVSPTDSLPSQPLIPRAKSRAYIVAFPTFPILLLEQIEVMSSIAKPESFLSRPIFWTLDGIADSSSFADGLSTAKNHGQYLLAFTVI